MAASLRGQQADWLIALILLLMILPLLESCKWMERSQAL